MEAWQCLSEIWLQQAVQNAIKEISQLLADTDRTVQQIAAELNFSNRTHFYKLFAEHTGMTPRQYRLKYHGNTFGVPHSNGSPDLFRLWEGDMLKF